jgi:hypothetical protein
MVVLVLCLVASMAIAIVRLTTTPTEILGDGFRGLPERQADRFVVPSLRNEHPGNEAREAR